MDTKSNLRNHLRVDGQNDFQYVGLDIFFDTITLIRVSSPGPHLQPGGAVSTLRGYRYGESPPHDDISGRTPLQLDRRHGRLSRGHAYYSPKF